MCYEVRLDVCTTKGVSAARDVPDDVRLRGDVVAIPTETVYGLGGWIQSEDGLRKIFSTKERPFFDPLIVHIDSISKAKLLTTEWTEIHQVPASFCQHLMNFSPFSRE